MAAFALLAAAGMPSFIDSSEPSGEPVGRDARVRALDCSRRDEGWTARFQLNGPGWTGGDGAQSIDVGRRRLWVFGDSYIGRTDGGSRPQDSPLVHSAVLQETPRPAELGFSRLRLVYPPRSLITTAPESRRWLWPADGLYESGEVRQLVFRVTRLADPGEGMDFEIKGVSIARLSWPGLQLVALEKRSYRGILWGLSLHSDRDGHTYIYGWDGIRNLYVARAQAGALTGPWRYRTRDGWSPRASRARPILRGITTASVARYANRYVLISSRCTFSDEIVAYVGRRPYGPFESSHVVYRTPESGKRAYTYAATAHPQVAGPGLLIGYSVNAWRFEDNYSDASIYRPRFIRLDLNCVLRAAAP